MSQQRFQHKRMCGDANQPFPIPRSLCQHCHDAQPTRISIPSIRSPYSAFLCDTINILSTKQPKEQMLLLNNFAFFLLRSKAVFNLVLAESALETIPRQLWQLPLIRKYAEKRRKKAQFLLLDRSYHHAAMKNLAENEKKGRPDIVHFSLLEALGSPLNKEGLLQVYVHTMSDYVISVSRETRLPRNYDRFVGLMEQLFELKRIPPEGSPLLTLIERMSLCQLAEKIKPDHTVAFSRKGTPKTLEETISELSEKKNPLAIIGGFPHSTFSKSTTELADQVVSIDREMLETWTVTARIVYEYEKMAGIPSKRLAIK
jgi:rRNA small subunit pseudouridine methyltransferase Nep1